MMDWSRLPKIVAFACCCILSLGSISKFDNILAVHAFSTTTPLRHSSYTLPKIHAFGNSEQTIQKPNELPTRSFHFRPSMSLGSSKNDIDGGSSDDELFDAKTTFALIGGQSVLIVIAVIAAKLVGTPNYGLGPGVNASLPFLLKGILWTLPLGGLAVALDVVEDKFPALQAVTKATQSSVLSLLGGTFKPLFGVVTALALGAAAGIGEEMLFRGVLQFELGSRLGSDVLAIGLSSVIFGALHAVTPLYAGLASLASVYFGWLYLLTGNLVVPIVTHAFYDFLALLYAHWTVANMSESEKQSLIEWRPVSDK